MATSKLYLHQNDYWGIQMKEYVICGIFSRHRTRKSIILFGKSEETIRRLRRKENIKMNLTEIGHGYGLD
jgi:hypothetical protein